MKKRAKKVKKVKKVKAEAKAPRRFMLWRRSVQELESQSPWRGFSEPTINNLKDKVAEAQTILNNFNNNFNEIVIVEIVKVVKRTLPQEVVDFKGLK